MLLNSFSISCSLAGCVCLASIRMNQNQIKHIIIFSVCVCVSCYSELMIPFEWKSFFLLLFYLFLIFFCVALKMKFIYLLPSLTHFIIDEKLFFYIYFTTCLIKSNSVLNIDFCLLHLLSVFVGCEFFLLFLVGII